MDKEELLGSFIFFKIKLWDLLGDLGKILGWNGVDWIKEFFKGFGIKNIGFGFGFVLLSGLFLDMGLEFLWFMGVKNCENRVCVSDLYEKILGHNQL